LDDDDGYFKILDDKDISCSGFVKFLIGKKDF
jgi:hypothetical protein